MSLIRHLLCKKKTRHLLPVIRYYGQLSLLVFILGKDELFDFVKIMKWIQNGGWTKVMGLTCNINALAKLSTLFTFLII